MILTGFQLSSKMILLLLEKKLLLIVNILDILSFKIAKKSKYFLLSILLEC
jgi:hypothetical protein